MELSRGWSPGVLDALRHEVLGRGERLSSGVLVGALGGGGIRVDAVIPVQTAARVTAAPLDHAGWGRVHEILAQQYADRQIVGWYVGRPGGGAAVTEADADIHRRFFPGGHLLLSVDPRSGAATAYAGVPGGVAELFRGQLATVAATGGPAHGGPARRGTGVRVPILIGMLAGAATWIAAGADAGVLG